MTYLEMVGIIGPVALAMRQAVDTPTFKAYHRVLEPVQPELLRAAADAALEEPDLKFFPSAPEWKGRCETQRRRMLALHPFEACAKCHGIGQVRTSPVGLVPIRYGPCQCRTDYEQRIERLGLSTKPLAALPPAEGEAHHEASIEAVALPEPVQERLHAVARSKVMR